MAAGILAAALLSTAALAKDVANTGTARPASPLSAAHRAALATKDAVRRTQETQVGHPGAPAKPAALVFVGPQRQSGVALPVALKGASPSTAAAAPHGPGAADEATLEMLRALMGPERAVGFGIAKRAASTAAARPAPSAATKDARR